MTEPLADFSDAYNRVTDRYTGNIAADLSAYGVPPNLADAVAATCCAWAVHRNPPPQIAAALAFHVGVMTGIEWERARPPHPRAQLERDVVGALRSAIDAHGPIVRENATSAAKRVIGALKAHGLVG